MVNKGNCLCAGTKTKFLQGNTKLRCSKPRAGQARIACQVNGEVSRQQREPTEGLSESGRNLLRLRRGGCQEPEELQAQAMLEEATRTEALLTKFRPRSGFRNRETRLYAWHDLDPRNGIVRLTRKTV